MLIDLQVTCDHSSHLILFDIMKLFPSKIDSEKILQPLSIHLKSSFCSPKALSSVLNFAGVNNRSKFLGCFCERISFLFLYTLKAVLIEYLII